MGFIPRGAGPVYDAADSGGAAVDETDRQTLSRPPDFDSETEEDMWRWENTKVPFHLCAVSDVGHRMLECMMGEACYVRPKML